MAAQAELDSVCQSCKRRSRKLLAFTKATGAAWELDCGDRRNCPRARRREYNKLYRRLSPNQFWSWMIQLTMPHGQRKVNRENIRAQAAAIHMLIGLVRKKFGTAFNYAWAREHNSAGDHLHLNFLLDIQTPANSDFIEFFVGVITRAGFAREFAINQIAEASGGIHGAIDYTIKSLCLDASDLQGWWPKNTSRYGTSMHKSPSDKSHFNELYGFILNPDFPNSEPHHS
jgi:hypothetical protein